MLISLPYHFNFTFNQKSQKILYVVCCWCIRAFKKKYIKNRCSSQLSKIWMTNMNCSSFSFWVCCLFLVHDSFKNKHMFNQLAFTSSLEMVFNIFNHWFVSFSVSGKFQKGKIITKEKKNSWQKKLQHCSQKIHDLHSWALFTKAHYMYSWSLHHSTKHPKKA